ncbi:MAG: hypothetical protein JO107_01030 [Hyphomicrobiales bacterium]|nr:hypothetical protein [Hyphomicrobiales bacterium]
MALLGEGVLAIWNGIAPTAVPGEAEADFVAWHVREHIPERVGLPGFLRGRRYSALDGDPAYFNFYETATPAVLTSPDYVARLNDPTPWTRRVVAQFRDTSRTVCDVAASIGRGEGGVIETIRLRPSSDPASFAERLQDKVLRPLGEAAGIVGVHLLRGRPDSAGGTAEKKLRAQPDEIVDWILLVEAVAAEAILAARTGAGATAMLERHGVAPGCRRGLYLLQFALTHDAAGGGAR